MKTDKNQCLKYTAILYELCLASSQVAITQDFQQTEVKKGKSNPLGMKDNIINLRIKIP